MKQSLKQIACLLVLITALPYGMSQQRSSIRPSSSRRTTITDANFKSFWSFGWKEDQIVRGPIPLNAPERKTLAATLHARARTSAPIDVLSWIEGFFTSAGGEQQLLMIARQGTGTPTGKTFFAVYDRKTAHAFITDAPVDTGESPILITTVTDPHTGLDAVLVYSTVNDQIFRARAQLIEFPGNSLKVLKDFGAVVANSCQTDNSDRKVIRTSLDVFADSRLHFIREHRWADCTDLNRGGFISRDDRDEEQVYRSPEPVAPATFSEVKLSQSAAVAPQRPLRPVREEWTTASLDEWNTNLNVESKALNVNQEQARAIVAAIEDRTGEHGRDLAILSAINENELGPVTDTTPESIFIVEQKTSAGNPTIFLVYSAGKYVDYKFEPIVRIFDTKALPPLSEIHLATIRGKGAGGYAQISVSRNTKENGTVRTRASILTINNNAASIKEEFGTVMVDGCQQNPNTYQVSSRAGFQHTEDWKKTRHYYEHVMRSCNSGPSYGFESALDAEAAYQWVVNGGHDKLE